MYRTQESHSGFPAFEDCKYSRTLCNLKTIRDVFMKLLCKM